MTVFWKETGKVLNKIFFFNWNKLLRSKKTIEYFFIGWEESDSHDECVAKLGKWHVPESIDDSAVLVNVQMYFIDGMICNPLNQKPKKKPKINTKTKFKAENLKYK